MKNGHKRTQRKHPTDNQIQRIKNDIRSLRDSGKDDITIRETLGLEERTYRRYTHIIHLEDQQIWLSITQEQLSSELLRLHSCLNYSYNIAKQLSEDSKLECQDRLAALQSMLDSRLSMVQLLQDIDMKRTIKDNYPEQEQEIKESTLKRIH